MFRAMTQADIGQLLALETATQISPWTEETFNVCFRSGYLGWVVEIEKRIIGFVILSVQMDECHILNVVVAHAHQQQGWGRKLMEYALIQAEQRGAGIIYLEVRRSNSRAITLYRKLHFHLIGERKDYYPTVAGQEDALIFARSLRE
jgi:ribosomal-protein-alanine N-acetyltransferase